MVKIGMRFYVDGNCLAESVSGADDTPVTGAILGSEECAILDRIEVSLRHTIEERKGSSHQKRLGSFSDFRTLVGTFADSRIC